MTISYVSKCFHCYCYSKIHFLFDSFIHAYNYNISSKTSHLQTASKIASCKNFYSFPQSTQQWWAIFGFNFYQIYLDYSDIYGTYLSRLNYLVLKLPSFFLHIGKVRQRNLENPYQNWINRLCQFVI